MPKVMHKTLLTIALGLFLACPPILVPCPIIRAESLKIGYIDIGTVFDNYERTKRSEANLEKRGEKKEEELEKRIKELKKLRESLELLSEEARENKGREIEKKADELKRFTNHTKRDLLQERDDVANKILDEIQKTVKAYAGANGFALVLDERSLLYGEEAHDITDAVLKQLNTRYGKQR